jgi:hypothetical protein
LTAVGYNGSLDATPPRSQFAEGNAMATDQRFDPYGDQPEIDKPPRSWLSTCLIGCLVIAVVGLVVAVIVGYWVSQNWRDWTATAGAQGVMQAVNASDLPQQEKQEIELEVNRVAEAFRGGDISVEQVGMILERLSQSPLMASIMVSAADAKYINQSGLNDEEQAQARITVHRFVRGAVDGKIDEASVNSALEHIADRQQGGGWQLRDRVTDEELRAFLNTAKSEADAANIPAEPEVVDPSDQVKRLIDEALNEPAEAPLQE